MSSKTVSMWCSSVISSCKVFIHFALLHLDRSCSTLNASCPLSLHAASSSWCTALAPWYSHASIALVTFHHVLCFESFTFALLCLPFVVQFRWSDCVFLICWWGTSYLILMYLTFRIYLNLFRFVFFLNVHLIMFLVDFSYWSGIRLLHFGAAC